MSFLPMHLVIAQMPALPIYQTKIEFWSKARLKKTSVSGPAAG